MKRSTMSEAQLQQHIVKLLDAYARHDIEWHHVPNGEDRHPGVARRLKLMGVRKGVADLMFLIDGKSIAVELKTEIGTVSGDQFDFQERFERAGGAYHVAFGLDHALATLNAVGAFRPGVKISSANDGHGVRRRPWEKSQGANANSSPREVGAPV